MTSLFAHVTTFCSTIRTSLVHVTRTNAWGRDPDFESSCPGQLQHRTSQKCAPRNTLQRLDFFRIPFDKLDLLLYAWENEIDVLKVASVMDLTEDAVRRAFRDFTAKNRATAHLREMAYTVE